MPSRKIIPLITLFCLLAACQPTKRVVVLVDGQRRVVETQASTVDDVLRAEKIQLGENDRVDPPGYTPIERTATIQIVRVEFQTEKVREPIEYGQKLTRDEALPEGQLRVLQLGANGEAEVTFQITLEDHQQVSRRQTSRVVINPPRDEILVQGTQNSLPVVELKGTLAYLAHGNAWVARNSSNDKRPLTVEGDLDGRVFDLSPDGRFLLFTRTDSSRLNTLWLVDTVILDEKPRPVPLADLLYAQWAPDGSNRIAYSTGEKTSGAPGWKANNDLAIAQVLGISSSTPLTTTVTADESGGARRADITVSSAQVLSSSVPAPYGWWGGNLQWSPDAQVVAFGFSNQVGLIDIATRIRRPIKSFAFYNTRGDWVWTPQVAWSPDSRFLVATVHGPSVGAEAPQDSQSFEVWVLARDNSIQLGLARDTGMWSTPSWSPRATNGESQIAYGVALNAADSERSRYRLYVMDRDGSNRRQIWPQANENGLPFVQIAWSPDATQLAAIREGDVWLFDLARGSWAPLTANGDTRLVRWK